MISVQISGLKDVIEAIRAVPTSLDRKTMFSGAVEEFTTLLANKTPPGWSQNLRNSVMSESVLVGYSAGVEKPGNQDLDGKPRRGAKRWVPTDELETVLMEAVSEYSGSVLGFASEEVDSVLS